MQGNISNVLNLQFLFKNKIKWFYHRTSYVFIMKQNYSPLKNMCGFLKIYFLFLDCLRQVIKLRQLHSKLKDITFQIFFLLVLLNAFLYLILKAVITQASFTCSYFHQLLESCFFMLCFPKTYVSSKRAFTLNRTEGCDA